MWHLILQTLYLFLPAYAANMAPVVAKRLHLLPLAAKPIDSGRTLWGRPVLGPHKTYRGLIVGLCVGILVAIAQDIAAAQNATVDAWTLFPYTAANAILWGMLMGGGALVGDLAKSFIKRRFSLAAGSLWFPWDQLDMVFGSILLGSMLYRFSVAEIVIAVVLTPIMGLIVNVGAYVLSVKEAW